MTMEDKTEDGFSKRQSKGGSRWLYFFLGVFMVASIGLAIALIVKTVNDNDDDRQVVVVTKSTPAPATSGIQSATTTMGSSDNRPHVTSTTHKPEITTTAKSGPSLCTSADCVLRAGELLAAMDRTVSPCHDFYQYACGNWIRTHSIPETDSSYSRFGELRDKVALELKGLLEKPYDNNTESASIAKAKKLYRSCLDEDTLTKIGVNPLKRLVRNLGIWPVRSSDQARPALDLEATLVKLAMVQVTPFLNTVVKQDNENSSLNIIWITQPGFGIGRNYMVNGRNSSEVMAYEEMLVQLVVHVLGLTESSSLRTDIGHVVQIEVDLAKMSASRTEMRNDTKFYMKMTVSDLQKAVPKLNWMKFLTLYFKPVSDNITVTEDTEVVLYAKEYLNNMLTYYQQADRRDVDHFLLMKAFVGYFGYLSKDIRDLNMELRKVLYGVTKKKPRWKNCVSRVDSNMPTALGQLYVATYFSNEAKEKAEEMISYIRQSMSEMINDVAWMDEGTKAKAKDKLHAITQKIGYPDYQFNETALEQLYKNVDYTEDAYFQNMLDFIQTSVTDNSLNLLRTPSKITWSMSASTVNTGYSPSDNTITFPAGILQPPLYSGDFPMAMMFGGIGTVIGHEITHGFDNEGRKYDKNGNKVPWWSNSSVAEYEKLTKCYVDQYGQSTVAGMHVNGKLTLGENIADNGGVKAAFMALQKWQQENGKQNILPGLELSNEQLFFVNFAQGWCNLITDEGAKNLLLTDVHSPFNVRVRVSARNSQHFADAFRCPVGSPMNPTNKCHLW